MYYKYELDNKNITKDSTSISDLISQILSDIEELKVMKTLENEGKIKVRLYDEFDVKMWFETTDAEIAARYYFNENLTEYGFIWRDQNLSNNSHLIDDIIFDISTAIEELQELKTLEKHDKIAIDFSCAENYGILFTTTDKNIAKRYNFEKDIRNEFNHHIFYDYENWHSPDFYEELISAEITKIINSSKNNEDDGTLF